MWREANEAELSVPGKVSSYYLLTFPCLPHLEQNLHTFCAFTHTCDHCENISGHSSSLNGTLTVYANEVAVWCCCVCSLHYAVLPRVRAVLLLKLVFAVNAGWIVLLYCHVFQHHRSSRHAHMPALSTAKHCARTHYALLGEHVDSSFRFVGGGHADQHDKDREAQCFALSL